MSTLHGLGIQIFRQKAYGFGRQVCRQDSVIGGYTNQTTAIMKTVVAYMDLEIHLAKYMAAGMIANAMSLKSTSAKNADYSEM